MNPLLGKIVASTRLCRITKTIEDGATFFYKQRCGYAALLIRGAETFLRPPFHVLPERDWLKWEAQLYRRFYGLEVKADSARRLKIPALPGIVLADYWRLIGDVALKLRALTAALQALRHLHQVCVRFPWGTEGFYSHGDATAGNVIFDPIRGEARWFDFETIHDVHHSREWRQADDLRAFTCSAAGLLPEKTLSRAAQRVVAVYDDPGILRELGNMMDQLRKHPDPFHLGQTQINSRQGTLWETAIGCALTTLFQGD